MVVVVALDVARTITQLLLVLEHVPLAYMLACTTMGLLCCPVRHLAAHAVIGLACSLRFTWAAATT